MEIKQQLNAFVYQGVVNINEIDMRDLGIVYPWKEIEFTAGNIVPFLGRVKELGYVIESVYAVRCALP